MAKYIFMISMYNVEPGKREFTMYRRDSENAEAIRLGGTLAPMRTIESLMQSHQDVGRDVIYDIGSGFQVWNPRKAETNPTLWASKVAARLENERSKK